MIGLPSDITRLDLYNHFKKAGIIVDDHETGEPKIKIITNETGACNGEASITYLKEESVGLAIQFLNDSFIRPNIKIKVQKGRSNKKQKLNPNEGPRWGGKNYITLKHMFHPSEAEGDPNFYQDLKTEVSLECERKCGTIDKVTVFDGSPEGVIAIKFATSPAAEKCIDIMNGRFFGGRQIECQYFDGHPNSIG